jgi:hypothetical protein
MRAFFLLNSRAVNWRAANGLLVVCDSNCRDGVISRYAL